MRGNPESRVNSLAQLDRTDQISERRNATEGAGNPYAPESLLSGGEIAAGLGYYDHRLWPDLETYKKAVAGLIDPDTILAVAPRVKGLKETAFGSYSDGSDGWDSIASGLDYESRGFQVIAPGIYAIGLDGLISDGESENLDWPPLFAE